LSKPEISCLLQSQTSYFVSFFIFLGFFYYFPNDYEETTIRMCLHKAAQKAGGIAIQIGYIKYLNRLTQIN